VEPGERLRVGADGAISREPMHPFLVGRRVDPNRDDRQALLGLPGVGPARAIAIERARPLHAAADLGGVRGLGPRAAAEVAPLVDLRAAPPRLPPPPPPRVAVNTASAVELEALPGVGPVLAGRIVAEREARGPFRGVADLERVAGIGPATAARLAEHVELGP
jgi:competence ComEA-like helix-hairpin-helix protein